jgi:hypothetical protein
LQKSKSVEYDYGGTGWCRHAWQANLSVSVLFRRVKKQTAGRTGWR